MNARAVQLGRATEESAGKRRAVVRPSVPSTPRATCGSRSTDGRVGYADVSGPRTAARRRGSTSACAPSRGDALGLLFAWARRRAEERAGPAGVVHVFVDERGRAGCASCSRGCRLRDRPIVVRDGAALDGGLAGRVWPAGIDRSSSRAMLDAAAPSMRPTRRRSPITGATRPRRRELARPTTSADGSDSALLARSCGTATRSSGSPSTATSRRGRGLGWVGVLAVRPSLAAARTRHGAPLGVVPHVRGAGQASASASASTRRTRRVPSRSTSGWGCTSCAAATPGSDRRVSALRARCPDCRTLTAVAFDDEYQCHSCGREFAAGLVRVPRAWGAGRRVDGGGGVDRAAVSRGGRDRGGDARGPGRRAGARACRPGRSSSAAAAARTSARSAGSPAAPRPARRRLDRRARRPQHARDLAVREPLGDAAADGDRRGRGRARRTSLTSGPGASTRPRSRTWRSVGIDDDLERALDGCDARLRRVRLRRPPTRASSTSSCPSPEGRPLTEAEALLRDDRRRRRRRGPGADGVARPTRGPGRRSRGSPRLRGCNPRPESAGLRWRRCPPPTRSTSRSSTSRPSSTTAPAKKHPNTCPGCGSHYRDDELRAHLRVCPQCGHHFPVKGRERIEQLRGRRHVRRGRDARCAPATRSSSSTSSRTPSGSPRPRSRRASATR